MIQSVNQPYSIEQGFIVESHTGEGTVRVRTISGRILEHVRLNSMLAGPGFSGVSAMPLPNTECLVLATQMDQHYILGLFPPEGNRYGVDDPSAETLPGEWRMELDSGHVVISPDGTIDLMAHPWLRMMFIGREHFLREFARKWERISSPINLMRSINDESAQASLYELFVNDRFLYRAGDATPSIIWTLGRNHPDLVSEGNPRSDFLSFFQVESRLDSTAEATARSTDEQGLVKSVVRRFTDWIKTGDVTLTEERGNQDGVARICTVRMVGDDITLVKKEGHFTGTGGDAVFFTEATVAGTSVWSVEVRDDGRLVIKNPSWTVTLQENKVAIIESDDTHIKLNGERLEIGGQGSHEPMVMGAQLVDFLNQVVNWLTTHTHPTPAGPSTPSIQIAQLTSIASSFGVPTGAPNSKLTSNANYVSGGSGYPSGGDAATEE